MKHFLKKALGFSRPDQSTIRGDLARLDKLKPGLGKAAADYVLTGEGGTVLSSLAQVNAGKELAVCQRYTRHDDKIAPARRILFLDLNPFDAALVARYAEVLVIAVGGVPDNAAGSKKSPDALRVLMGEAFNGSIQDSNRWPQRPRKSPPKGLTPDRLEAVAVACGGGLADMFEILFWDATNYGAVTGENYRQTVDLKPLVTSNLDAFFAGADRLTAPGREVLLGWLDKQGLVREARFFDWVIDQVGASSKGVREAALNLMRDVEPGVLMDAAEPRLAKGTVAMREGMVRLLGGLEAERAREMLEAHRETEKTARIVAAIDNAMTAAGAPVGGDEAAFEEDDLTGYTAIDGTRIDIPARRPIPTGTRIVPSKDDIKALKDLIDAENKRVEAHNREIKGQKYAFKMQKVDAGMAANAAALFEGKAVPQGKRRMVIHFLSTKAKTWTDAMMARMPEDQRLRTALQGEDSISRLLNPWWQNSFTTEVQRYIADPEADLREVEDMAVDIGMEVTFGGYRNRKTRKFGKGDLLRDLIPEESYAVTEHEVVAESALWPYLAENFEVLDEALGLRKVGDVKLNRVAAIRYLTVMPKAPRRYFGPLLEAATGTGKMGRAEARELLGDAAEVDARLIALLDDTRQAVRAGAAEWMAERGQTGGVKALKARLKKEKSEIARAAMLSALKDLGEPLDAYVGPAALLKEAEAGLKKAKLDKLSFVPFDHLPAAKYVSGKAVPPEVLKWWIALAFKLKQPGGNGLFEIYLDQLAPDDAAAFSQFVFDAWVTFDTERPPESEANAHAEKHVDGNLKWAVKWDKTATRESVFAGLKREFMSQYLNSGAASKGLIGLTTRMRPDIAAARVSHFLKNHGKRTSQSSAMLEMLAAKGDPVSLQVVISAATRLKQKGVQAFAGELVQKVADENDWTMDELADRTIPTAGLDDAGVLELPCGVEEKVYSAVLTEDLTFALRNPSGDPIKGLPSGDDEATKAAKKQLSTSRKELKQVVAMQRARLYEGLCSERIWEVEAWTRDFRDHPVMRKLTERLVWLGLDKGRQVVAAFRPTAEGDYVDLEDGDVDPGDFAFVRAGPWRGDAARSCRRMVEASEGLRGPCPFPAVRPRVAGRDREDAGRDHDRGSQGLGHGHVHGARRGGQGGL